MLKKGVLSTAEKFYIESHSGLEVELLAKALNRSVENIEKHLKSIKKHNKEQSKEPEVQEKPKKSVKKGMASEMMGRHKGAVIMTPNASELGDSSSKNKTGKNMDHIIFKPRG